MSKLSKACHKQNGEENRFALFYDGVVSDLAQNKNFPCVGQNLSDLANVRTAYDKVVMETGIEGNEDVKEIVHLKQKIDKWQSSDTVTIAGITHSNDDLDTDNWKGYPVAGGICEASGK